MKIEKVNDHQIRCTLTKEDLADRELKISELAYGTEKAKNLFRDMMQQASFEFGFEAEDIPLMIEAIPLNAESIVLIITKVEDPEELDTRFSKFAPSIHESDDGLDEMIDNISENSDDVLDFFKKVLDEKSKEHTAASAGSRENKESKSKQSRKKEDTQEAEENTSHELIRLFSFDSIHTVIKISKVLAVFYHGVNSLYKNEAAGRYILLVSKGEHTHMDFGKVCNILSEYGNHEKYVSSKEAYLEEHSSLLLKDNALQTLSQL
ncbi:MAG: adaptor protein MecA [Lachnospiraceae bacterium]|nr:adaptor protein MecA [Lachnospiraceae bacterium]